METDTTTPSRVWTIGIGGAAGDGIREAGIHFGELVQYFGFSTFLASYYPSLIRGGHNYSRLSFSTDPVYADHSELDLLIAINEESVRLHQHELRTESIVLIDEAYAESCADVAAQVRAIPMERIAKEAFAPRQAAPSVALGSCLYISGISQEELGQISEQIFSDMAGGKEINRSLALQGYQYAKEQQFPLNPELFARRGGDKRGELTEGNKAVGKGFLDAGLDMYLAYPMTPATSLLHYLAKESLTGKVRVIHPEDEIAVINMALGVSYAGKRVAIGSATGGFALMQEAFSFAGISELPIAIAVSQRQGPATGVATHSGQGELRFVIHAGHGEFPRIVIAPGDAEECYKAGVSALNLSWKYQVPAIVLLDKHVSESLSTVAATSAHIPVDQGKRGDPNNGVPYQRYQLTDDGISPMVFPGSPNAQVKATSYEHEESGIATDDAVVVKQMQDKRFQKLEAIRGEFSLHDSVKVYGDPQADVAVIFWGSTKGPVLEAAKYIRRPVTLLQIIWMEPFDVDRVIEVLNGKRRIIDIEANHTAQLAGLLRERTGIDVTDKILRYDSEVFDPIELAKQIDQLLA